MTRMDLFFQTTHRNLLLKQQQLENRDPNIFQKQKISGKLQKEERKKPTMLLSFRKLLVSGFFRRRQLRLIKIFSPRTVLASNSLYLTSYEEEEIKDFPSIYFFGKDSKKLEGVKGLAHNHGYDDDSGSYLKVLHDHLAYRYEVLEVIGKV